MPTTDKKCDLGVDFLRWCGIILACSSGCLELVRIDEWRISTAIHHLTLTRNI